jgi:O-phosphoseryl-tRNA(Cys) synthetase
MPTAKTETLIRKQIMLSNENLEKLASIAKKNKTSVAHVVRNAVDSYEPDAINEDSELTELVELLNCKLDDAIKKTEATEKYVVATLKNLSTRKNR